MCLDLKYRLVDLPYWLTIGTGYFGCGEHPAPYPGQGHLKQRAGWVSMPTRRPTPSSSISVEQTIFCAASPHTLSS